MKKLHVLIVKNTSQEPTYKYTNNHAELIKQIAPSAQVTFIPQEKDAVEKYIKDADILIVSLMKYIDLQKAKKLKWMHVTSAGVTDIAAALKNTPILLTNSSGVHPIQIAEHVFAYMLMFARHMHTAHRIQILEETWKKDMRLLPVSELYGKTIGIVGFGRIGERIAELAKVFDMKVLAYSTSKKSSKNIDKWYGPNKLDAVLRESDYIINCLPLTDKTKHIFTKQSFKKMKPAAYFINIGRGQTVVENDLIDALKNRVIAGAGLDVFELEPLPDSSELWKMENVIITPHNAGSTPRYLDRVIEVFCENLKAYRANKPMPMLVDKEKGY